MDEHSTSLWLPGRPVAWSRTDRNPRTGRRYNRAHYQRWLDSASWEVRAQVGDPIDGPCAVSVLVMPNGIGVGITPAESRARPVGLRGDLDNYLKAALDACDTGGAFTDDRLVEAVRVVFHPKPGGPE